MTSSDVGVALIKNNIHGIYRRYAQRKKKLWKLIAETKFSEKTIFVSPFINVMTSLINGPH